MFRPPFPVQLRRLDDWSFSGLTILRGAFFIARVHPPNIPVPLMPGRTIPIFALASATRSGGTESFFRLGPGRCRRGSGPCRIVGETWREVPVASRDLAATCGRLGGTSRHGGGTCGRLPDTCRQGLVAASAPLGRVFPRAGRGKKGAKMAFFGRFRPFCRKMGWAGAFKEVQIENSPALQGWVRGAVLPPVPEGRKGWALARNLSSVPAGLASNGGDVFPALKGWAIFSNFSFQSTA